MDRGEKTQGGAVILSTDRNGKQSLTLLSGEMIHGVTFHATRPLWQVKWWRRITVGLTVAAVAGLLAFAYWLEESRSTLLLQLTRENRVLWAEIQCRKQLPLILTSWIGREERVKTCVEKGE